MQRKEGKERADSGGGRKEQGPGEFSSTTATSQLHRIREGIFHPARPSFDEIEREGRASQPHPPPALPYPPFIPPAADY